MWLPALILGFAGSAHCLGMCGPIALAVPVGRGSATDKAFSYLFYHFGRVGAYAILGFAFGTLGYALHMAGAQRALSIGAGLFMMVLVWAPKITTVIGAGSLVGSWQGKLTRYMAGYLRVNRPAALLSLGFLNGLLPCGLVYLALAGAVVSNSAGQGAAFMALFGLGTLPALVGLALAGNLVSAPFRKNLTRMVPYLATAIALLFIVRGLNLDIPYLSPSLAGIVNASATCHP